MISSAQQDILRSLPQVEEVLRSSRLRALEALLPHQVLADCAREAISEHRENILNKTRCSTIDPDEVIEAARTKALGYLEPSLRRAINATGVIVHTNLGRSPLADEAAEAVMQVARSYSTLEYDTNLRARGSRHDHVEGLLCALTGAEAAIAVNNNAAAVVMVLAEFAKGHEAIVSRGELVEIGGSFRIPDIMAFSDACMVEVGTTNKTHAADYERALGPHTSMLLKVHPSNYRVVGFSESVAINDLREIADRENERRRQEGIDQEVLVYEDQGSGAFINLACFGEYAEPTVAESVRSGCDLVSFSGDKLLGGPQAGIVVGSKHLIDRLKKNPLARAMRLDKMTLAALEATLRLYLNPDTALKNIPTLRMLSEADERVHERAERLADMLRSVLPQGSTRVDVVPEIARTGGGALPLCEIASFATRVSFERGSAQDCEIFLVSKRTTPIIPRIKNDAVLFDARTLSDDELPELGEALCAYFESVGA
ncbi:L-seryl-tRNA(Sec) selenium transferase [Eggerthella sp. YY7918]|uniref:L-seryl-tRNA(Sec) selenium transferase n=1 Tax=Eggerthella sp. (strain YY7918) TaxID=502558 RepID=UPI0002171791|nr:L-seryl-tRNA(Sec) selenium transferase [Eggerthella sp. YY7918]BAK44513.1 selenocysteine synthase [Eggerthella sp. YY7918]